MSIKRIIAITFIYLLACGGWGVLGTATFIRSHGMHDRLSQEVEQLYGRSLSQKAPTIELLNAAGSSTTAVMASAADIRVTLNNDPRRKGLNWYPTYNCQFAATYTVTHNQDTNGQDGKFRFHFSFPDVKATYNAFAVKIDDQAMLDSVDTNSGLDLILAIPPGSSRTVSISYETRGMHHWTYIPTTSIGRVRNLNCQVITDFTNIDFLNGSLSPMRKEAGKDGTQLAWQASDLITRQKIGIIIPQLLNPGPVTTRITYFAPVCLGFFFLLISTITIVCRVGIHPMHYLFVAGGFFAFHLLLAYLVDHISMHAAFIVSSLVSLALTTTYLRTALGPRFPTLAILGGQTFFLVLFSYSFFLQGVTGLTVALGSVVTLGVLMAVTARIDWSEFFAKPQPQIDTMTSEQEISLEDKPETDHQR